MTLIHSFTHSRVRKEKSNIYGILGLIFIGMGLSVVIAYLVVDESWQIALGIILAIPVGLLLNRYPFVGLMVWLILMPFLVETNGGVLRKAYSLIHRVLPLAMLGFVVTGSLLRINKHKLPKLGWPEVGMLGYILVSVLSILYLNDDIKATLIHYYDRVVIPMCLYLFVRLSQPGEKELRWLLPVVIFIVITQTIIGLLSWMAPQFLPSYWLGRVGTRTEGSFGAYSVFTSTLAFCGLFIAYAAVNEKLKFMQIWYLFLLSLALFMIFLSFSRGSWLAAILIMFGLIYIYPKFMLRYLIFILPIVMLVLSAGFMSDYRSWASQRFYSEGSREAAGSRLPIYYASYQMFKTKPLFGWGYNNFDRYDRQFQTAIGEFSAQKDHASHNVYLTLIAEQGITGLLLFTLPLLWWLVQTLSVWGKFPQHGFVNRNLIFIFWLVMLFHVVVNNFSNMRVVFGLGMWWITLGLIACTANSFQTSRSSLNRPISKMSSNAVKNFKDFRIG